MKLHRFNSLFVLFFIFIQVAEEYNINSSIKCKFISSLAYYCIVKKIFIGNIEPSDIQNFANGQFVGILPVNDFFITTLRVLHNIIIKYNEPRTIKKLVNAD